MLGEARFHLGPMALIPSAAALEPFETAIALDSSFAPAYIHPIELRLATGRDSASAAGLIEAFARYGAPDRDRVGSMRLGHALVYGAANDRPAVDTLDAGALRLVVGTLRRGGTGTLGAITRLIDLSRAAPTEIFPAEVLRRQDAIFSAVLGRTDRFVELWPGLPRGARAVGASIVIDEYGGTLPDHLVQEILAIDSTFAAWQVFDVGVVATHVGESAARAAAVDELRHRADGEGEDASFAAPAIDALAALERWSRGSLAEAASELERVRRETIGFGTTEPLNNQVRLWLGTIEAQRGRHQEALRYLASVEFSIQARLLMAEAYEELGRADSAAIAYDDVLTLWAGADPDFAPADRARRGLARVLAER